MPQERDALKEPNFVKKVPVAVCQLGTREELLLLKILSGVSRGRSGELPLPLVLEGESLGAKTAL